MSTFAELDLMARHHLNKSTEQWRQTRWLATVIVNIHSRKPVPAERLLRLPDEVGETEAPMTREQFDKLVKRFAN